MPPEPSTADLLRQHLHAESGFAEDAVPPERLRAALDALARDAGIRDGAECARRALGDPLLRARLESHFSPPETWLFRYPASFELLRTHAASAGRPLRVAALACGGWCEPISIAAALGEVGGAIDAVDRNGAVLAAPPRFGGIHARGGLPAWAARHFKQDGASWAADPALASMTTALVADAAAFARAQRARGVFYDAVFFRNAAIYMNSDARRAAFAAIAGIVREDGLLFVGHAESSAAAELTGLRADPETAAFALRRTRPADAPADAAQDATRSAMQTGQVERIETPRTRPVSTRVSARLPAPADPLEAARAAIARAPLDAGLHLELARIHEERGDRDEAAAAAGRALYVDPSHEDALVFAARLAEARGAADEAHRLRMRALEAHLARHADRPDGA